MLIITKKEGRFADCGWRDSIQHRKNKHTPKTAQIKLSMKIGLGASFDLLSSIFLTNKLKTKAKHDDNTTETKRK